MQAGTGNWRSWTALLAALLISASAGAQRQQKSSDAPELQVSNSTPVVEEPVLLQVLVYYEKDADTPDWPKIDGATITGTGGGRENVQRSFVGDREVQHITWRAFNAELVPHKAGALEIPPIAVKVDGATRYTKAARIRVQADDGPALLSAEIRVDAPKVFVGQRVTATLLVRVLPPVIDGRTLDGQFVYNLLDPRRNGFGQFPAATSVKEQQIREDDGTSHRYYVYESTLEFTADRAGPLDFENLTIAMRYPKRLRQDIFGTVDISDGRVVRARPEYSGPEVRTLPVEGRPPMFNGAVGRFKIAAWAKPTKVRVGDPIEYTMELTGDGALDTLPGPQLDLQPALQRDFRVPGEALAGRIVQNGKWFTQTIRAKRADVQAIPPVEYAFFDPIAEKYQIIRGDTIPLTVTGGDLGSVEVEGLAGAQTPEPTSAPVALDGLRGNETRESLLLSDAPRVSTTAVWMAGLAPPLVFSAIALARIARERAGRDVGRARRSRALATAEQRLRAAESLSGGARTSAVEAAVAAYLADRLNVPPARFTGRAALELLRQRAIEPDLEQRLAQVIGRCEHAAYGGGDDGDARLAVEARDCLRLLERRTL